MNPQLREAVTGMMKAALSSAALMERTEEQLRKERVICLSPSELRSHVQQIDEAYKQLRRQVDYDEIREAQAAVDAARSVDVNKVARGAHEQL
jgi:hypothetical protein